MKAIDKIAPIATHAPKHMPQQRPRQDVGAMVVSWCLVGAAKEAAGVAVKLSGSITTCANSGDCDILMMERVRGE